MLRISLSIPNLVWLARPLSLDVLQQDSVQVSHFWECHLSYFNYMMFQNNDYYVGVSYELYSTYFDLTMVADTDTDFG